jgi:hypothetical protein
MSFLGLIFVGAAVFSLLVLVIKIAPAYIEYASVKNLMYQIGQAPNFKTMSNADIASAFDKGAKVSYITSVKSSDLLVYETDQRVVAAEYQVKTPLIANMSLLMNFKASTEH